MGQHHGLGQHNRIISAVLGDDQRLHHIYVTNAQFHAAMHTLANIAPLLANLMADDAEREAEHRRLATELSTLLPPETLETLRGPQ